MRLILVVIGVLLTVQPLSASADGGFHVTVTGGSQEMFKQTTDGICSGADWIDSPARAWWGPGGIRLITPSSGSYPMVGSSLGTLQRDCSVPLSHSAHNPDYNAAADMEWPTSVYSFDGQSVVALVHNEWHRACTDSSLSGSWVNSITVMQSTDGGVSFSHPDDYRIRVPLVPWSDSFCTAKVQSPPIFGSFGPPNMIGKDGWYYAFFGNGRPPNGPGETGRCIMRSQSPASGSAWQVWTGSGWGQALTSVCKPVLNTGGDVTALNYSTYLGAYMVTVINGSEGVEFYTSSDLMNWSAPVSVPLPLHFPQGDVAYPSVLSDSVDPSVTGRNFENIGQDAWLYFVTLNTGVSLRYLMRVPIHFETINPSPNGSFDSASCEVATGWACDDSDDNQSVQVNFTNSPTIGVGTLYGSVTANTPIGGNPAVCGGTPKHYFSWVIPASLKDGQPYNIYAFALNIPSGGGNFTALGGNPKTIQCAPPAQSCTVNGTTLPNGQSSTFYYASSVQSPALCSEVAQTRTCTNGALSGSASYSYGSCTQTNPLQLVNSLPPLCTLNWSCTAWGQCSSPGVQTRTCTDTSNCGVSFGKPAESQSCTVAAAAVTPVPSPSTPPTFTSSSAPSSTPSPSSTHAVAKLRATATVNVRTTPSLVGTIVGKAAVGSTGTPTGEKVVVGKDTWIRVSYDNGLTGWSVQAYLITVPTSAAAPTPTASCPALTRTLSRGSRGTDVTALQQFLIAQSLLAPDSATGYFGAQTEAAVKKFQSQKGIASNGTPPTTGWGVVGPKTRAALPRCN